MKYLKTFESITNQDADKQLAIAVHQNKIELVKKALEAGANPNTKDDGSNLIFIAVLNNNVSIVKELLKAGVNPNVQSRFGYTPLIDAARDRGIRNKVRTGWEKDIYEENILEELIKAGADWNLKNQDGEDFFDFLSNYFRQPLIDKYPEQYKEYMMKKDANKYNI